MKKDEIIVSIVMPVYNVEQYLSESIESALNQKLKNFEIICVDDGSTDESGRILDMYMNKDSRVKVIHKQNTGYGNSMNVGIDNANGKYIGILEPDDFIAADMYKDLVEIIEQYDVDFVKSNFAFLQGEREAYQIRPTKIYDDAVVYNKVLKGQEKNKLFKGYIAHWTGLYKKNFLDEKGIRFHESPGASYQDTGFWFQTLANANSVYMIDKFYYHYRCDNPNASMKNRTKVFCICKEYDYICERLQNSGLYDEYLPEYIACRFAGCRDTIERIADEYKEEFIMHISAEFRQIKEDGKLDSSAMWEKDRMQMTEIVEDPQKYYKAIRAVPDELHHLVAKYNKIYIYGAGEVGRRFYRKLRDIDKEKVAGYVVTRKVEGDNDYIDGVEVIQFDRLSALDRYTGIAVAVSTKYEQEIVKNLKENNLQNIIFLPPSMR